MISKSSLRAFSSPATARFWAMKLVVSGLLLSLLAPLTGGAAANDSQPAGGRPISVREGGTLATDYSRFIGGGIQGQNINDEIGGIAACPDGSYVLVGGTHTTNFPVTPGAYDTSPNGGMRDAYVARVSADGNTLVFSTYIGGLGDDLALDVAVDEVGNIYVVGVTTSSNFPTTPGALDRTFAGDDGFVCKISADGSELIYSTLLGGEGGFDYVKCCALAASGALVVGGETGSLDFPVTNGAFDSQYSGAGEGFAARIDPTGAALDFATFLGGDIGENVEDVALDNLERPCFIGQSSSTDFPSTPGSFDPTPNGSSDAFVLKLASDGTSVVFGGFLGGSAAEYGYSITSDRSGALYVCGTTLSSGFPTTLGAYDTSFNGDVFDGWFAKVSPNGTLIEYSSFLGGNTDDECRAIALTASGLLVIAGYTESTDFPLTPDAEDTTKVGREAFLLVIDLATSTLRYSTFIGGSASDSYKEIATRNGSVFFLGGDTLSLDFPDQGFGVHDQDSVLFSRLNVGATDTAGVYVPTTGAWFLRNDNSPGAADLVFGYGPAGIGWLPLEGDWDRSGTDTAGLYDPATGNFFLKNTNAPGAADLVYGFGPGGLGWRPLVGDWDGDGVDTIGLYDPASGFFFLRNVHAPGAADLVYGFGPAGLGWEPILGDWDGNGSDTVGLYDPANGNFFLRNVHASGAADIVYGFGPGGLGWKPQSGDWNGDGTDTVGLYSPTNGFFFLRNTHAPGAADVVFGYGPANTTPILGDWNGQ